MIGTLNPPGRGSDTSTLSNGRRAACAGALFLASSLLTGCNSREATNKPSTPVRVQTTKQNSFASEVMLTGQVAARIQSQLSFRIDGRIESRDVDVGDHVEKDQVLATLETTRQVADVTAATAGVASAQATLKEAQAVYERQKTLLAQGFTTQPTYDRAKQAFDSAVAALDGANANLGVAEDSLANTKLRADAAGIVTARNAEVGQYLAVGQPIFTIAEDGPRDAVFDVFEALLASPPHGRRIELTLLSNPSIKAVGTVREVAPTVDPGSGTVRVKVEITGTGSEMGLGSAVSGTGRFNPRGMIILPWTAFFADKGASTVWVVDPKSRAVSMRSVEIYRYRTGEFVVSSGLSAGEMVVTQGAQLLYPGEVVDPQTQAADGASGGKS